MRKNNLKAICTRHTGCTGTTNVSQKSAFVVQTNRGRVKGYETNVEGGAVVSKEKRDAWIAENTRLYRGDIFRTSPSLEDAWDAGYEQALTDMIRIAAMHGKEGKRIVLFVVEEVREQYYGKGNSNG